MRNRLVLSVMVFVVAAALCWTVVSQPAQGTVRGVCVDRSTGRPLAHCIVWLNRDDAPNSASAGDLGDSGRDTSGDRGSPEDDNGDLDADHAPAGWQQTTRDDGSVDAAGAIPRDRSVLQTRSDDAGRFVFTHVTAGSYHLSATSPARQGEDVPAAVEEGRTFQAVIRLALTDPTLSFQAVMPCWLPGQSPIVGLEGRVSAPEVAVELDRCEIDLALGQRPETILDAIRGNGDSPAVSGLFRSVRRWSARIAHPDRDGQFYQRVALGPLPPGLYRVVASQKRGRDNLSAEAPVLVTRLALVRKASNNQVLAFVTDAGSGHPAARVPIALYAGGGFARAVSMTTTSPEGLARLSPVGAPPENGGMLLARDGDSIAALPVELNSPGDYGSPSDEGGAAGDESSSAGAGLPVRAFIYTDRPVYRPGQTVYLKGIERRIGAGGPAIPAGAAVAIDIRDAQETLVSHELCKTNDMGSWTLSIPLSAEALTGEYAVTAAVDGWKAHGVFAVAAYRKPEYALTVSFDKDRYIRGDTVDAVIKAAYYFGTPVAGAQVEVDVTRSEGGGTDDEGAAPPDEGGAAGEPVLTRSVKLDENGEARLRIPTGTGGHPTSAGGSGRREPGVDGEPPLVDTTGDQVYHVAATVNDNSGRTADGSASVVVGQGAFSLSVNADPLVCHVGTPLNVRVIANTAASLPVKGQPLRISFEYESWGDGGEVKSALRTFTATTSAIGAVQAGCTPPREGLLIVSATGKDGRGNVISAEQGVWVSGDGGDLPVHYPDLSVVMGRKSYSVGQTAHLLINTDHPGPSALVTVEGASVYHAWVVPLRRHSTAFDLRVEQAYAPDVTISVCCFRDRQFFSSEADVRMADARRALHVAILPDRDRYHPGDVSEIHFQTTDDTGRPAPAELSVGVVDESIYAIRPEPAGTILDAFEPEQSDNVQTANSCERIYMGDVDKGSVDIHIRKDFPDTALWQPVLRTDAQGRASVRLKLPDSLTTWRITCVGHTARTAVGKATAKIVVNKDLLVRLENPRFLVAGDTAVIVAMVHNNTRSPLHAHVRVDGHGLPLDGSPTRDVDVIPGKPTRVAWTVTAATTPVSASPGERLPDGSALPETVAAIVPIQVTVRAGPLNDGVQEPLVVVPHGARSVTWQSGSLLYRVVRRVTLHPDAIPGTAALYIRLAPSGESSVIAALGYLAGYPYGSTDSTASTLITNAVVIRAAGPAGGGVLPVDAARRAQIDDMIHRSLLRLYRFQRDDGGWGWWDAGKEEDLWMTADATWALILAKDAGCAVSGKVLSAALDATARLSAQAREDSPFGWEDRNLSLAALLLARGARPASSIKNIRYLAATLKTAPHLVTCADLARLTAAAKIAGDSTLASDLMGRLWTESRNAGSLVAWARRIRRAGRGEESSGPNSAADDVPDVDSTAWGLLAAESVTPDDPRIERAARWLMASRTGDHWDDPSTTAVVALDLIQWMARSHEAQPDFTAQVECNGKIAALVHFDRASMEQPGILIAIPAASLHAGFNEVSLRKQGRGRLYYSLEMRQSLPVHAPPAPPSLWRRALSAVFRARPPALPFTPSGYRIKRIYLRLTSRRGLLWEDSVPARDHQFNTGENIVVRLIIDSVRPGSHLVVEEPIPPGCEITETPAAFADDWNHWWDYTDVRDDRIVFFISDLGRGRSEIDYHLQARTPGSFDVMPTLVTSTFDPSLHALGQVDHITVDPGSDPSS